MKKGLLCIFGLVSLIIISGCSTIQYNIALQNVESPSIKDKTPIIKEIEEKTERIDQNGKKHIDLSYKYEYKDDNIEALFTPTNKEIRFDILNKTNDSIKLIWDDAAFVDIKGNSHKIMHYGVKFIDRNSSWPPSIIVKQQKLSDAIMPTDNVDWSGQDWVGKPLLPITEPDSTKDIKDTAQQYVGKKIQVLLPLQIYGQQNNYIFTFEVKNFTIKKQRGQALNREN